MNKLIIPTIIVSLAMSSVSWSKNDNHQSKHYNNRHAFTDWAKVSRVESITRTVERNTPNENCWVEQVRTERPSNHQDTYSGTVLGGIIGGALGNAVGHRKKNKQVGTAIGAVLGATVGYDMSTRGNHRLNRYTRYQDVRRCEVSNHVTYEDEVVGYHVWYRHLGNEYKTRMNHHPGKKIKVRVSVEPF